VLLVLGAVVESGRAGLGAEVRPPWEREVTVARDPLDLRRRTALPREAVRRAVDRAISAELLDLVSRVGDELVVRVRPDGFADAPVVAAVDWDAVRDRLGTAVSPIALLLVREIARRTPPERRARHEAIPVSLRELGAATGASKGTIQKTLGALHAATLVESWARDRVDSWHRLLPAAFGERPEGVAVAPLVAPVTAPVAASRVTPAAAAAPGVGSIADPATAPSARSVASLAGSAAPGPRDGSAASGGEALVVSAYEVNGIRWPLPHGVRPRLERDAEGGAVRRIGNLRLPTGRAVDATAPVWFEVDGIAWDVLPGAQPELEQDAAGSYWYRIDGDRWPFRPA
jgi:hypothetical protein